MVVFHIHNDFHLGDQIFNMIFFYNIKYYLEQKGIFINYYCLPEYLDQVQEFKSSNNIQILPLTQKPSNSFHMWVENDNAYYTAKKVKEKYGKVKYNLFFIKFFNFILKRIFKSSLRLNKFFYFDQDLIVRYQSLQDKFKDVDILFLNSQPNSGQYDYNKGEWDNYIRELHSNFNYKIVTTTYVEDNIHSTIQDHLTIKSIAAISTQAKIIIAINSGVIPGLLNIYTLKNVRQFYTFDKYCEYTYPNFRAMENINHISFQDLKNFLL